MSALPFKADIKRRTYDVRFVPTADIGSKTLRAVLALRPNCSDEACRFLLGGEPSVGRQLFDDVLLGFKSPHHQRHSHDPPKFWRDCPTDVMTCLSS
jgi:hypothetical protein